MTPSKIYMITGWNAFFTSNKIAKWHYLETPYILALTLPLSASKW